VAILIGHAGFAFSHNVGVDYLANENGLCAHIHLFGDSRFQIGNGIMYDYRTTGLAYLIVNTLKLIHVPARFEAKAAKRNERSALAEYRGRKDPVFLDELRG